MANILEALTGLSNPQNFGPTNPAEQFDPRQGSLAGLSQQELMALLLSGKLRMEDLQQIPPGTRPPGPLSMQDLTPLGQGPSPTATPSTLADQFRSAVAPVGQPDYRNAGLVPGIYSPTPTAAPSPTPTDVPPPPPTPTGAFSDAPVTPPTAGDILAEQAQQRPYAPPQSIGEKLGHLSARMQGQEPSPGMGPPEPAPKLQGISDLGDYLGRLSAWAQKPGPPAPESIPVKGGLNELSPDDQYSSVPPGDYSEGGAGDLTGGSSPVPPPGGPYSDASGIDTSTPIGKVVAEVAKSKGYPPPAPTDDRPVIGKTQITAPTMPPITYPKDELTPYDAGIGEPPGSNAAAPAQQTASGGLANLKNILMGFSPSTPAGQALLAFGFANAAPGGNIGDAGLQALQVYTSAQNRRAEEQFKRDELAQRDKETAQKQQFQWKLSGRELTHQDIRSQQAGQQRIDLAKYEAEEAEARRQADQAARAGEADKQRRWLAHADALKRKAEEKRLRMTLRASQGRADTRAGALVAKASVPQVRTVGKDIVRVNPMTGATQRLYGPGANGQGGNTQQYAGYIRGLAAGATGDNADNVKQAQQLLHTFANTMEASGKNPAQSVGDLNKIIQTITGDLMVSLPEAGGAQQGQPGQQAQRVDVDPEVLDSIHTKLSAGQTEPEILAALAADVQRANPQAKRGQVQAFVQQIYQQYKDEYAVVE